MRELAYIHGIDEKESIQRSGEVKPAPYIPYNALTQGEFTLALLAEKAKIMSEYYQSPMYREESQMFQNALYRGIHGSTPYVGAIPNELVRAARAINYASRLTKPATRFGINGRPGGIGKGIYIGAEDPVIPYTVEEGKCKKWVADFLNKTYKEFVDQGPRPYEDWDNITRDYSKYKGPKASDLFQKCLKQHEIEKILNAHIEKCGHHTLYGYLPKGSAFPATITSKTLNERIGQEVLASIGEFDTGLIRNWLNIGVMRYNTKLAGLQPYNQAETNAILTTLPPAGQQEWLNIVIKYQKIRNSVQESNVVSELMAVLRKYNQPTVGIAPAVVIAIIGACVALLGAVTEMISELENEKANAFGTVSGIGTQAFGPEENDWSLPPGGGNNGQDSGSSTTPLLIGGAILAAVLVSKN